MKETPVLYLTRYLVNGSTLKNGRGPGVQKFPYFGPPLALKNSVSEKGGIEKNTACVFEINALLSCLKDNDFTESACFQEAASLRSCEEKYKATVAQEEKQKREGILIPYAKSLSPFQVNKLLKKYPQPK